jgi:hypothetical protein
MMMARMKSDASNGTTQTSELALSEMASHIKTLVIDHLLDSRCAAKLVRRLRKESDAVTKRRGGTRAGRKSLLKTFDAVDKALRQEDAALLVAANAALRADDDASTSKERKRYAQWGAILDS